MINVNDPNYKTSGAGAYLRPINSRLFDTEIYPKGGASELVFFETAERQPFRFDAELKTYHDTNLQEMRYPREFSILGFTVDFDEKTNEADKRELLSAATFGVNFSGLTKYINIPLNMIQSSRDKETSEHLKYLGECLDMAERMSSASKLRLLLNRMKSRVENGYDFRIGERRTLKIKNGEKFNITLSWKKAPKVSAPVRITAAINGIHWREL